jgi:rod shape-determining protein MreC
MLGFVRRNGLFLTSGTLLCVSLFLVSVSARAPAGPDPIARLILDGLRPLQQQLTGARRAVHGTWETYIDLRDAKRENVRLRERIAALEQEVVALSEAEKTNERLSELLGLRALLDAPAISARVIGRDPLPWFRTFTVDRGERDGLRRGMAVLSPQGVVGQIAEVSRTAARVLLLTDRNSGIDAVIQRSRARGIVQGALQEGCYMEYLRPGEDVVVGDRVMTSGLDGIFPKGMVVGEVTELVYRHRGLLRAAVVRPSTELDRIEEVLIVDAAAHLEEAPE